MWRAVWPSPCISLNYNYLACRQASPDYVCPASCKPGTQSTVDQFELPSVSAGDFMPSVQRPPNRLLQALPEADYEALHQHLEVVLLVREAVLVEAGAALTHVYLPHAGAVSMVVNLSE